MVEVEIEGDKPTIAAPQPLQLGAEMPADLLAGCVGIATGDVIVKNHKPVLATVGNSFVIAEVTGEALTRAVPDLGRIREAHKSYSAAGPDRLPLYLYAHDGERVRTRMFSPLSGTVEDPATGSAATPLAALLLSLKKELRTQGHHRAGGRDGPAKPVALHGPARRRRHPRHGAAAAACRC